MKEIKQKVHSSYNNQMPFVVYNKPNSNEVSGLFQQDDSLYTITTDFDKSGFVFAPFLSSETTVLIPLENSVLIKSSFLKGEINISTNFNAKDDLKSTHINLVKRGIEAISNNSFKKVVLSRKDQVAITKLDLWSTYNKLLQLYSNAFVYMWFHPKVGLWFGATPETLLEIENQKFTTMALAGTQPVTNSPLWTLKEIEEQQLVTDYIVNKLSGFSKNLQLSDTETVRAGSLLHLRTEITGELDLRMKDSLFSLVDLLHPTPAVCGLPKEKAKQFILKNENYNRSYYTGYLGELNMRGHNKKDSYLFVNLRCMEIQSDVANVYIGGGITSGSVPEKEWEETVAKSVIMRKVL